MTGSQEPTGLHISDLFHITDRYPVVIQVDMHNLPGARVLAGLPESKSPRLNDRGLLSELRKLARLHLDEDDHEGEQRQRLDKRQAECQQQQDARPGAWIACQRLGG